MNLHKTLATVSGMTMLSRVAGLIREILFASTFGASAYTDAFNIAFRIPNLLRRLFAEGAFSQAFVPILGEYKNKKGRDATKHLVDHVATVMTWTMLFTCIIGIIAAVISDGVVSGEFHTSDVGVAALCTLTAVVRFVHPQLIAEFADKPSPTLDQMIDFVIAGLSAPANQPVS